jgi:hypothetical protein
MIFGTLLAYAQEYNQKNVLFKEADELLKQTLTLQKLGRRKSAHPCGCCNDGVKT